MKKDMPQGTKDDWRTIYLCENVTQALAVIHHCHLAMINTTHHALIVGDADHYMPNRFSGAISVSKADALKYVHNVLERESMRSRDDAQLALRIYVSERVETFRRKKGKDLPDRIVRTCWVG